eukprot:gene17565-23888_t
MESFLFTSRSESEIMPPPMQAVASEPDTLDPSLSTTRSDPELIPPPMQAESSEPMSSPRHFSPRLSLPSSSKPDSQGSSLYHPELSMPKESSSLPVPSQRDFSPRLSLPSSSKLDPQISSLYHPQTSRPGHNGGQNRLLKRTSSDHFASCLRTRQEGGRVTSPALSRSSSVERGRLGVGSLVGHMPRPRDKYIPLRYDEDAYHIAEEGPEDDLLHSTETEEEEVDVLGADDLVLASVEKRGRITVFWVADSFRRPVLDATIRELYPRSVVLTYPEVVYLQTPFAARGGLGDVFIFDYGIVACWGLTADQEEKLLRQLEDAREDKEELSLEDVSI